MSLQLKEVEKRYGEKILFRGLSYQFSSPGLYLLRGGSGSGKTTLLRMIAGFDGEYGGMITGGGLANCSFAFQEHRLFPQLDALSNVTIVLGEEKEKRQAYRAAAAEALLSLGFAEEDFKKKPSALSGGMKQRVALSRAFAAERPILLLDEPDKELDPLLKARLYQKIAEEAEKRMVLLVSHAESLPTLSPKGFLTL